MTIPFGLSGSLADTLANRPAPDLDKIGRFFLDTDAGTLYRDSGVAWLRVRDDATDRPRGGPLSIQVNDEHALQVETIEIPESATFDAEIADPLNLISSYEGLTGVSSANSDNGALYLHMRHDLSGGLWSIFIYSNIDCQPNHLVGANTFYAMEDGVVAISAQNGSGLDGTLYQVSGTATIDPIEARWTITPVAPQAEVFNVDTLTGITTIPQLSTPSTALVENLNVEFLGGKRAAEFAPAGGGGGGATFAVTRITETFTPSTADLITPTTPFSTNQNLQPITDSATCDGNTATRKAYDAVGGSWMQWDLGEPKSLFTISLWSSSNQGDHLNNFSLQGSLNGQDWTEILAAQSAALDQWVTKTFAPCVFRYLRIIQGAYAYWAINEISIPASGAIEICGLAAGQSAGLYNSSDALIGTAVCLRGSTSVSLTMTTGSPLSGAYVKVFDVDNTLLATSATGAITSGDIFAFRVTH